MQFSCDISSMEQLGAAAEKVLTQTDLAASDHATVLALSGDLGAGKTTFVQTLAEKLGVRETVTSPTFVIMKSYITGQDHFKKLVHIDAYRLESIDEMRVLGFADLLAEKGTIICVEWAERIFELLPSDAIRLSFELAGEKRTLVFKK